MIINIKQSPGAKEMSSTNVSYKQRSTVPDLNRFSVSSVYSLIK